MTAALKRDICRDHAIANMAKFIDQLAMSEPAVSVAMRSPDHDGRGWYMFELFRGIRTVRVDMPGIPYEQVFCADIDHLPGNCERLYVDGSSWFWCFAINWVRRPLSDHDGAAQRAREASEAAANAELDERPRCACGGVLTIAVDDDGINTIECLTCSPVYETRRENADGAVYVDTPGVPHYVVTRQHLPPEVPGHDNPMHPDALCQGLRSSRGGCRRRSRHLGCCEPNWKVIKREFVKP